MQVKSIDIILFLIQKYPVGIELVKWLSFH